MPLASVAEGSLEQGSAVWRATFRVVVPVVKAPTNEKRTKSAGCHPSSPRSEVERRRWALIQPSRSETR